MALTVMKGMVIKMKVMAFVKQVTWINQRLNYTWGTWLMKRTIQSTLLVITAILCANSYARGPSAKFDKGCLRDSIPNGTIDHIEVAPGGSKTKFRFGIRAHGNGTPREVTSADGYGLNTSTGRAMFDLLREAAEKNERVTVWCDLGEGADNVWIDYDEGFSEEED